MSWRHHFIPQSYLSAWAKQGTSRMIYTYARDPKGVVREKLCSTKECGYSEHLYSLRSDPLEARISGPLLTNSLEETFFKEHDNQAAEVLRKLREAGQSTARLESAERESFALFINGLMERDPAALDDTESKAKEIAKEVIAEAMQGEDPYGIRKRALAIFDPGVEAWNYSRAVMVRRINDDDFVRWITEWQWQIVDATLPLPTSDRPLVVTESIGNSGDRLISAVRLALNPSRLLIISPPNWELDDDLLKLSFLEYIIRVVAGAWRTVVSDRPLTNEGPIKYLRIVEHYLRSNRGIGQ